MIELIFSIVGAICVLGVLIAIIISTTESLIHTRKRFKAAESNEWKWRQFIEVVEYCNSDFPVLRVIADYTHTDDGYRPSISDFRESLRKDFNIERRKVTEHRARPDGGNVSQKM